MSKFENISSAEELRAYLAQLIANEQMIKARQDTAKTQGRLSEDLSILLNKDKQEEEHLRWEQYQSATGLLKARGYTPADLEKKDPWPSAYAYYCRSCAGWVAGQPEEEKFDEIDVLSGAAGLRSKCTLCETVVEEIITRQSLVSQPK